MSNAGFYTNLDAFTDFFGVADANNYKTAPDDWQVIVADIKGSTLAIAEGHYKNVNLVGAACINAVLRVSEKSNVPYVFGGDGATLIVAPKQLNAAVTALLGVRRLAEDQFKLSLRIGVVEVGEIHQRSKARVMVGKYRLSPGNELATYSGGGIELAESWIKSDSKYLCQQSREDNAPDLDGLSCRWEPVASQHGVMLSLLAQATLEDETEKPDLYRELIREIYEITHEGGSDTNPISKGNMVLRWPSRGLSAEIIATAGNNNHTLHTLKIYLNSLAQWCLDRFNISAAGYPGKQYRVEMHANTDYQRFNDTLRLLLDCSAAQADRIETLLALRAKQGSLRYGLHRSESALMTCLVFNLHKGEHIHFVDGSDGGFTAAAKKMKFGNDVDLCVENY